MRNCPCGPHTCTTVVSRCGVSERSRAAMTRLSAMGTVACHCVDDNSISCLGVSVGGLFVCVGARGVARGGEGIGDYIEGT